MSCYHKRFSITLNDKEVIDYIEMKSKKDNKSLSSTILDCLKMSVEYENDFREFKNKLRTNSENYVLKSLHEYFIEMEEEKLTIKGN
jgi:hypothetical protein